jgi:hypothetical protein
VIDLDNLNDDQLLEALAAIDAAEIAERQRPVDLTKSALYYAQRIGWPVFPIVARGKRPLTRHGFKDATRDPDVIRDWWATWPDANIGTPTGADGCGFDVIDVDGRTGLASLIELKHANCAPDCSAETFCHATGDLPAVRARAYTPGTDDGPGWHLYVDPTGYGNASGYEPGMDYRGAGGYVVVPPSMGLNGRRYTWLERPELSS